MRAVTSTFLQALGTPHKMITNCTYTVPGGLPVVVQLQSGQINVDAAQRTRRTAALTVYGQQADYAAMTTPGTVFHVDHGIDYGAGQTELVPVFHGEVLEGDQLVGDGTIDLTQMADHGTWLSRSRFLTPYTPSASTPRTQSISDIVTSGRPGTTVVITATDTGTVGTQNVWTDNRLDAITALCKDGNMDAAFQPDGTFLIKDLPNLNNLAVWTAQGVLESGTRQRPMDRMYNTVVVRPSGTNGAQITSLANPRHPNYIGVVPYFWDSPTIMSAGAALAAAQTILYRVLGNTETLSLGLLSNPALDVNDVIRVVAPAVNTDPANIYQHFIDSFTLDLVTGSMSLNTRSQAVSIT
jgi:hypothetical protein